MRGVVTRLLNKISELSEKCNLSERALLKNANLSPQTIQEWRDGTEPSLPAIIQICKALNCDISDIFTGENSLTESQQNILCEWRQLQDNEKNALLLYIQAMLQAQSKSV